MVCSCRLCCLCSVGVSGHLCGVKRFVYAFVPLVLHGFVRDGGARSFFSWGCVVLIEWDIFCFFCVFCGWFLWFVLVFVSCVCFDVGE